MTQLYSKKAKHGALPRFRGLFMLFFLSYCASFNLVWAYPKEGNGAAGTPNRAIVAPPANDDCENAQSIVLSHGAEYCGTTIEADADDPIGGLECGFSSDATGYGVWYTFTGDGLTWQFLFPEDINWDPEVNVYSGLCASLTCAGGDDDSGPGTTAQFELATQAGETYYIYVHDAGFEVSDFCFTITLISSCPDLSATPPNVDIANSGCDVDCSVTGGSITAPAGAPCPAGSTLEYQVDGGAWTTTLPTYNQSGPEQSIKTRCTCGNDDTMHSPESAAVTTAPGTCAAVTVVNNTQNVSCNGATDGAINITPGGGVPSYTYDWADLSGTMDPEDRSDLQAGTYTVTVTDANGCNTSTSIMVSQPAAINLTALVSYSGCVGAIDLTASGGVPGFTYDWADLSGTMNPEDRSGLSPATYTVTVSDANGCAASISVAVDAPMPSGMVSVAETSGLTSNDGIICAGASATLTASGGATYQWNTGEASSSINVSPLTTTTYTVSVFDLAPPSNVTFNYTGGMQTWIVPPGITSVDIEAWGAQGASGAAGGNSSAGGVGGLGGYAKGALAVTPGQTLNIFVGGVGVSGTGGYNGGGNGGTVNAGGGGGASDVRVGGTAVSDRVIVAGGGGGGGRGGCEATLTAGGNGGGGGGGVGANGTDAPTSGGVAGAGKGGNFSGVQGAYGAAGAGCGTFLGAPGVAATNETGGDGGAGQTCCCFIAGSIPGGGGGGGGYLGGGGGGGGSAGTTGCSGNDKGGGGGGGGGSSYVGMLTNTAMTIGVNPGNGSIIISYAAPALCPDVLTTTITVNALPGGNITGTENSGVASNDGTICAGGSATLTAPGGGAYLWNTNATTSSISVTPSTTTTYTVTVTSANACSTVLQSTISVLRCDFGDLPDTGVGSSSGNYATQLNDLGPGHTVVSTLYLGGATVDSETDGQQNTMATGDDTNGSDDEDGLTNPMFLLGQPANVTVNATNNTGSTANLGLFIDWNNDGDFGDANETYTQSVAAGHTGNILVAVTVPSGAAVGTYLGQRVRLSTGATANNPIGFAADGEVEDYLIMLACPVFTTAPANAVIVNSSCAAGCAPAGGEFTAPPGAPCPVGGKLQYQVDGGVWSDTPPAYHQDGPQQTIRTRCACVADPSMTSPVSDPKTTHPGKGTIE